MTTSKQKMSGADIFFECLKLEKVEYIFGYPGGATLKIYEKLYEKIDTDIQRFICRTSQTSLAPGPCGAGEPKRNDGHIFYDIVFNAKTGF